MASHKKKIEEEEGGVELFRLLLSTHTHAALSELDFLGKIYMFFSGKFFCLVDDLKKDGVIR